MGAEAAAEQHDVAPLILRGVGKSFDIGKRRIEALHNVDMSAARGVITGLIGPDGAGKTTLMRLAVGVLRPAQGSIRTLGYDTTAEPAQVQANVGYMPQRFGLYEDLSVRENLALYADLHGLQPAERTQRYDELLHMTGLAPFTRRLAGRLSGGMKQKLGLACTLLSRPRLLLLDEPTVGVDPVSRRELWAIVQRLVDERGTSVLLSTAYLDEAERCHEVVLLHQGEVLGRGAPATFSAPLRDRTYLVSSQTLHRRALQERLLATRGVVDAVLQGEQIRVVLQPDTAAEALRQRLPGVALEPVPPRFEDGFVTRLQQQIAAPPGHTDAEASANQTQSAPSSSESASKSSSNGSQPAVIAVDNLSRKFGDFYAVRNLTFAVERSEIFGLLGANGAGKTTTFRMLCGLLPPSAGTLTVAGVDLRHAAAAARARIGYMSQKFALYGALTVAENLDFFSSAYGLRGAQRSARVRWAENEFALGSVRDSPSADLSLGFKQRLALACALMHEPAILFLDEPTSGVDPLARREFWRRINALADRGVTVLITTHFMEEAEYCDRLAIMANGELLALDTPAAIKSMTRSDSLPQPTMEDAFIALLTRESSP